MVAPATSLFPLAQKFPAGIFFQEEWNETPRSVTTRFQQSLSGGSGDRKHTPTGTGKCNLSAKHRQTTGQLPTPEMPGDPVWDTQTHIQAWASSRDTGTFTEHLLNTRPWLEKQGSPACLQSCLPWELRSEPRHVLTSGPLHLLFPLLGCPPERALSRTLYSLRSERAAHHSVPILFLTAIKTSKTFWFMYVYCLPLPARI